MERSSASLSSALATLQTRWGSAAVRLGNGNPVGSGVAAGRATPAVHVSLALAALPDPRPGAPQPAPHRDVISTGFPALDAALGTSGLPAEACVVVRGGPSSGKTTLALRCVAEAQTDGDIVAWLDLGQAFDPVEAVGRGVDLHWLLIVRPADHEEGLALAAALLTGRSIGLLVVDLPARSHSRLEDQLRRLTAYARRVGARLIVLEPATISGSMQATLAQAAGLRLELERLEWLRLGRDVVGQRTAVAVAKNRYGPPGRRVGLDIHYLADGERMVVAQRLSMAGEQGSDPAVETLPTVEPLPAAPPVRLADGMPAGMEPVSAPSQPRLIVA